MLENIKLNLFKNNLAGFAYELGHTNSEYIVQIYLVIGKEDNYRFVKFRKASFYFPNLMDDFIESIKSNGYMPVSHWIQRKNNDKVLTKVPRPKSKYDQI